LLKVDMTTKSRTHFWFLIVLGMARGGRRRNL
jgi:hypothetical protein